MRKIITEKGLMGDKPIGITNGSITLVECPSSEADECIKKHHYSHKVTTNRFLSIRINEGGEKGGYIQIGYGIRPHMKHNISKDITKDNYCEFDRMWLSDDMPKFSESQVISLLMAYLKAAYPNIKFVITYADSTAGNTGVIYRATNAFVLDPIKADFYVLENGERVHPVTMWHRHKTRAFLFLQTMYPGIKRPKGVQHRFLYILDRKLRKKYIKENQLNAAKVSKETRQASCLESEVRVLGAAPSSKTT